MPALSEIDSLAFEFFREFARCECCLKVVGYCKPPDEKEDNKDAQPDWHMFAGAIDNALFRGDPEVEASIKYFVENPPKKQFVGHGKLTWGNDKYKGELDTARILVLVCRVRNNLFHGGKFNGHWFDPDRSKELFKHSLVLLRACIASASRVRDAYDSDSTPT